jgi:2-methylcitrate dehydratase PrpD
LGIKAAVVPAHLKMIDHGVAAGDRASRLTSLPYHMAVAALAPAAASEPGSSAEALPGALAAFMARIEVAGDDGLLAGYPSAWPARISVETRSGTVERRVDHVPGDPARPFAAEDVHGKFRRVVGPVLGPDKAEAMLGRLAKAPLEDAAIAAIVGEVNQICAAGPASGRVHPPNN